MRQLGVPSKPAGALSELLKSSDVYELDRAISMRPYVADKVKAVREGTVPRSILQSSLLVGDARRAAEDPFRRIVKSDAEIAELKPEDYILPYTDPVLRRKGEMEGLVRKLAATGFLTFRRVCRSKVGVFCVAKKDDQLRLIFDCRATNILCKPPPTAELATPNAFANLDLRDSDSIGCDDDVPPGLLPPIVDKAAVGPGSEVPSNTENSEDSELVFSSLDLTDAFYQLGWEGMSSYFCLDLEVRAGDYNVDRVFDEVTGLWEDLGPDDMVYPALAVLPMGFSWSLLFCHSLLTEGMLEAVSRSYGGCRADYRNRVLRDRQLAPKLSRRAPILAPYVDNGNMLCRGRKQGIECLRSLREVLDEEQLRYRDIFEAVPVLESVGLVLHGPERQVRNKPARVWRCYHAAHDLVRRGRCSGDCLRVLAGHFCHLYMLRRPCLAAMDRLWFDAQEWGATVCELPADLVSEILTCAALALVCVHEATRSFSPTAFLSDSSLKGFALLESSGLSAEWEEAGCLRERWRFVQQSNENTQLPTDCLRGVQAGFLQDFAPVFDSFLEEEACRLAPRRERLPRPHRQRPSFVDEGRFTRLPDSITDQARWRTIVAGALSSKGVIHVQEARIAVMGLRRCTRQAGTRDCDILSIGDNMAEVCAFDRGRARDHGLNAQCRQATALQLALNARWMRRYVETDRNASDTDSRLADRGLLASGQILSGQRLIAQLAARGASEDVARLRRQPRPTDRTVSLSVCARPVYPLDVPDFRPPPGLELPQPATRVVCVAPTKTDRVAPQAAPLARAVRRPAVMTKAPAPRVAPSTAAAPALSLPEKTRACRSVGRGGKAFIEMFAGCARLTGACREFGIRCAAPIELLRGEWCDCTRRDVQQTILGWLMSGRVGVCWLGTPCKFWSIAKQNKSGNGSDVSRALADFTVRIVDTCRRYKVSFILENPATSKLFSYPPLARALSRAGAEPVVFDMCRFGTSYLKPIRLVGTLPGLSTLGLRCNCTLPHEQLQGLVRLQGVTVWKTSLAGRYPPRLCRAIAALVQQALHATAGVGPSTIERIWDQELCRLFKGVDPPLEVPCPACPKRWRCEWAGGTFSMCGDSRERRLAAVAARRSQAASRRADPG